MIFINKIKTSKYIDIYTNAIKVKCVALIFKCYGHIHLPLSAQKKVKKSNLKLASMGFHIRTETIKEAD